MKESPMQGRCWLPRENTYPPSDQEVELLPEKERICPYDMLATGMVVFEQKHLLLTGAIFRIRRTHGLFLLKPDAGGKHAITPPVLDTQ